MRSWKTPVIVALVAVAAAVGGFFCWKHFDAAAQKKAAAVVLADVSNEQLRSYLAQKADADSDGLISSDEAAAVTDFGLVSDEGEREDAGLSNMGIDDAAFMAKFPNLTSIVCDGNALSTLDVSACKKLAKLACSNNQLTSLKVPAKLTHLYADGNQLATLDLSNCTGLVALQLDGGVSIGGATDTPSSDVLNKLSILASCYTVASDSQGARSGDFNFGAGEAATDGLLLSMAADPEGAVLYYADSEGTPTEITEAPAANLGVNSSNGIYTISQDQARQILASYYGAAPDDLSYLNASNILTATNDGWSMSTLQASTAHFTVASDFVTYGSFVRYKAFTRYPNASDSNQYTDVSYVVTAQEDAGSIFGYRLVNVAFEKTETETVDENGNATGGDEAEEDATNDLTGYLMATNSGVDDGSYFIVSSSVDGDQLTLDAQFGYETKELESFSDIEKYLPRATYTFTLSENCQYLGEGGTAPEPTKYSKDEAMDLLNSHNGLGVYLHVVNGIVDSITFQS